MFNQAEMGSNRHYFKSCLNQTLNYVHHGPNGTQTLYCSALKTENLSVPLKVITCSSRILSQLPEHADYAQSRHELQELHEQKAICHHVLNAQYPAKLRLIPKFGTVATRTLFCQT